MAKTRTFWKAFRSAITGRWVSKRYAAQHSDTTVAEAVERNEPEQGRG